VKCKMVTNSIKKYLALLSYRRQSLANYLVFLIMKCNKFPSGRVSRID
jgi:hypothetical protein